MKKIIIACDSYKGCLSSREVNESIASELKVWNAEDAASGIENVDSDAASPEIICLEMSDGGEGMLDAFLSAMKGERVSIHAHDALMRWIEAEYGIVNDTAIIEIAQTAGLALIEPEQRNPMKAASWGSATSDCGIGMLKAMGDDWKKIRQECTFMLASDVTNPLCGENGAAHVFAPQKGADAEMVEMLDARAWKFAEVSAKHFGYDRSEVPGAGAAGGLGYAFLQYFGAEVSAGAELLLRKIGFDEMIRDADLVITGEGHSDRQTLMGKLPQWILEHVLKNKVTTDQQIWLVSGGVSEKQALLDAGFDQVLAVSPQNMDLEEAMNPEIAKRNIANAIKVSFGNT